jgi:O-methyltransferase
MWPNTSLDYVGGRLSRWSERVVTCPGDVLETLEETETGPLSFIHVDLNASRPTLRALEYAYPRLVPNGVFLFDDYGFAGYESQREVIDEFFASRPEQVVALPTGQAFAVKIEPAAAS